MPKSSDKDDYECPVFSSSPSKCDQDALEVMEKFKDFYEEKLKEIDRQGGGDCLEMKLKVQRRWIDDLTEQTQMMGKIVKELEEEATNRVRMLEKKLHQTSKSAYEVMKRYQTYSITHNLDEPFQKVFYLENDMKNLIEFIRRVRDDKKWSIEGLQFYDVTHSDLFGKGTSCDCEENKDVNLIPISNGHSSSKESPQDEDAETQNTGCNQTYDQLTENLKRKTEEYENLRQSMLDMRSALTEEVACKHDMISALKKDIQQLEERCVQSDKQTAFKDDIIKELRKEIKQLKQANTEKQSELVKQLAEAKSKMKRMRPCVELKSTCTGMDDKLVIKKSKLIQNKDDIIQIQTDTLNVIDLELQTSRKREKELEEEIGCRQREVDELKCKCQELEKILVNSQGRAENLQKAVDLYINSINVLEASEEKARIEMEQQKVTIANLQEALVNVKQELDELRQSSQQEVDNYYYLSNVFYVNLKDLEDRKNTLKLELAQLSESYKKLQDCSFELEIEHFNALQDLAILETQLYKYQSESRSLEEAKSCSRNELKKLTQLNRYYEHVIDCFKHEMTVMSEQLCNLQEILKLSNQSSKEESGQLHNAVLGLQQLSEKLQAQLIDTEKKALIENQKNQMKDAKIDELHLIIGQKNADLNVHDVAINEMKMRLDAALLENHELQGTIAGLNTTIMQLQCCIQNNEVEKSRRSLKQKTVTYKRSLSDCRDDYEKKSRRIECLETAVKSVEKELERAKEKSKEKVKNLKRQNEELKEQLATSEQANHRIREQMSQLKEQLTHLTQRDCCREHELSQSKQVIIEMRQTLIELNENLAENELHHMVLAEECQRNKRESQEEDIYCSARCEIVMYKKLVENFKDALLNTTRKLTELENRNKALKEELKNKEYRICDLQKQAANHEKQSCECIEELKKKLKESQAEERRLSEFIDNLKQEVQKKIQEKQEVQKTFVKSCECKDMSATQEEISSLKIEIKNMIQNQLALNTENDRLLKQVGCLQCNISQLEEKNHNLKLKLDKHRGENQCLKEKIKLIQCEKETCLQTAKNLEAELTEARINRDDLCVESRHVVNNVKAWLEEQRKINNKVMQKTQCYCETIAKLKHENESLLASRPLAASTPYKPRTRKKPCPPFGPPSLWCSGSQGTGSSESLRESPESCPCSVEEWYSPTYRDDDETEDNEEQFVQTVEALTREMRYNNRRWKNKCQECVVTKDDK